MNLTKSQLKTIIIEEYLREEGILDEEMSDERKKEMIDWIKGRGPRPKWATDDLGTSRKGKGVQSPMDPSVDRAADTMPLSTDDMPQYDDEDVDDGGAYDPDAEMYRPSDIPSDDAPERHVSGFQDRSGPPLEDQVTALVQDLQPQEMLDLFTAVIEKLAPQYIEPEHDERPVILSPGDPRRKAIREMIKKVLKEVLEEGHYHDMGGEDEMYDVLDPEGLQTMSDEELLDLADRAGIEVHRYESSPGEFIDDEARNEILAYLKDV
tara:strand:+ start:51 stop:845 length:795 start_codon:yes stop_codon:yes gene_type:complete